MSEGARHCGTLASLFLRLSDKRRPTPSSEAGPERADEGGGPDVGRLVREESGQKKSGTPDGVPEN